MVENNPHKISTMGTGGSLAAITDGSDFPHSGLIKGLSQMARQNIVVKNNSNDFDITQSTANGGTVTVSAGTYLRDGKKYVAQYKTGTTAAVFTFNANELSNSVDKGYHLVVVDVNNFILVRKPTVLNKVPDYTSGDTIIAVFEYASTSSSGAMNIQYLTTDKTENSVSIAYAAGTGDNLVYTEASAITGTSEGLFISGIGTATVQGVDKVLIQDTDATGVNDVIKTVTAASIAALAPQGDITGVALTAGTGIDLTSVANATAGDYAATIAVDVSDFMTNGVNNRVVTATGTDGMNAEAGLTVTDALTSITSGITQINKNLALMPQGGIGFVVDTPIMYISDANNILALPAAGSHTNQMVIIKNMKSANLTINTHGSEKFDDGKTYSKDSRWDNTNGQTNTVILLPLQSIRLQAVNDSIVIPIDGAPDTMASGWMIVDSTTINVDTVYTHPNHSGEVTSTGDGATVIVDNIVDEANLKVSNTPTNGYALTAQSGNTGGLTWAAVGSGNITEVVAGTGLTGGATTGAATLNVIGGDGITANANEIEVTVDDSTIELSATDGAGAIKVKDGGIVVGKMAANSVDSDQYVDGSIDHVHLAGDIIDGDNIQDDAVDTEHIANDAIEEEHIGDGEVKTAAIANSNVTLAKIANIADDTVLGNIAGSAAAPAALTAAQLRTLLNIPVVEIMKYNKTGTTATVATNLTYDNASNQNFLIDIGSNQWSEDTSGTSHPSMEITSDYGIKFNQTGIYQICSSFNFHSSSGYSGATVCQIFVSTSQPDQSRTGWAPSSIAINMGYSRFDITLSSQALSLDPDFTQVFNITSADTTIWFYANMQGGVSDFHIRGHSSSRVTDVAVTRLGNVQT